MIRIKDFKGRVYNLIEICKDSALLECVLTGDKVRIRSYNWDDIGFVRG